MELLCDEAQVDAGFGPFGDSALFTLNIPYAQKSFWTNPMELLGDVGHVKSCFVPFGDSVSVSTR
jgi:hypothetical protein